MEVELDDIPVHSLVPEALRDAGSAAEFLAGLPAHDADMAAQQAEAAAAGECLRYVAARTHVRRAGRHALLDVLGMSAGMSLNGSATAMYANPSTIAMKFEPACGAVSALPCTLSDSTWLLIACDSCYHAKHLTV